MSFCKKGLFSRVKALNQFAVILSSKDRKLSTDDFAQNLAFQEKEKKKDNCLATFRSLDFTDFVSRWE